MTSEDVKATFERYARISPNKAALKDVVAYETPDPIRSSSGSRDQCGVPGCVETPVYPFVILPADQREKAPRDIDVVGTGPFMLSEWRKDSHLIIKRFVGYVADEKVQWADGFTGKRTVYVDAVRSILSLKRTRAWLRCRRVRRLSPHRFHPSSQDASRGRKPLKRSRSTPIASSI